MRLILDYMYLMKDYVFSNGHFISEEKYKDFKNDLTRYNETEKPNGFSKNFISLEIEKIFNEVMSTYEKKFPESIVIDDNLKEQIKIELLLQLYNFLSTCTSENIEGIKNFIDATSLDPVRTSSNSKDKMIVYDDEKTMQRPMAQNIALDGTLFDSNQIVDLNESLLISDSISKKPVDVNNLRFGNKFFVRTNPLLVYIYDHISILSGPREKHSKEENIPNIEYCLSFINQYRLSETNSTQEKKSNINNAQKQEATKDNPQEKKSNIDNIQKQEEQEDLRNNDDKRIHYFFTDEGKYFLAILLKEINSEKAPYTQRCESGATMQVLQSIFETFYISYHQFPEINENNSERFLFLINTENIFQISFLNSICNGYKKIFKDKKHSNINHKGFEYSSKMINILYSCPLNVMKIKIWDTYLHSYFDLAKEFDTSSVYCFDKLDEYILCTSKSSNSLGQLTLNDEIAYAVKTVQEMSDCFFYTMLEIYDCFLDCKYNRMLNYGCRLTINDPEKELENESKNESEDNSKDESEEQSHNDFTTSCKNMKLLKNDILEYLSDLVEQNSYNSTSPLTWSILETNDKNPSNEGKIECPKFQSSGDAYYDFVITYMLYHPTYAPSEENNRKLYNDFLNHSI